MHAPISVDDQHADEGPQRARRLQLGDHRRRVVNDGQGDRGDQQRSAQGRRDDPPDDEPGRRRRGGVRGGARGPPHHQQHRQQRHHAQLAAADRDRHLVHAQPHAGDRAQRAGHVAVGDDQLQQRHRRDDDQRHHSRTERNPQQVARLVGARGSTVRRSRSEDVTQRLFGRRPAAPGRAIVRTVTGPTADGACGC